MSEIRPNQSSEPPIATSDPLAISRFILFRTDAGPSVGLGHLVRCIALAEALARRGHSCRFAGAAPDFLAGAVPGGPPQPSQGVEQDWGDPAFLDLVAQADLLVSDHYEIGADWQRQSAVPVLAICDPPLKPQHCDLLLLPAAFEAPAGADVLLAPEHSLLRSSIRAARRAPKKGTRLLVSCGGGEDGGLTRRIAEALAGDGELRNLPITIVLGSDDQTRRALIKWFSERLPRARFLDPVADMAAVLETHDIAIGASGGSALERACLGFAQLLIPIADNQNALCAALAARDAAIVLPADAGGGLISQALHRLVDDTEFRQRIAGAAFDLVDGLGAERVADAIEQRVFTQ